MGYTNFEENRDQSWVARATVGAAAVFAVLFYIYLSVSYNNRAVVLENQYKVTYKKVQGTFDNMWRIIEGRAGVTAQYKDDFLNVIKAQSEGRKGGDVMKFVHEIAPGLSESLYRDVGNAIEGQRVGFRSSETELTAIEQEHTNLRTVFPGSWFCGSRAALDYKVVTSARTRQAFETGNDESEADPFRKVNQDRKTDAGK